MDRDDTAPAPGFVACLAGYAVLGCVIFAISILIADFVVPDHDWLADTISDLGAGRYEFIVDIGIYAFAAALIALALLAAHLHPGGARWSAGVIALAILGLIVFLVGARNEYGDNDNDGVVIHIYLVYGLGVLIAAVPWLLLDGARHVAPAYVKGLIGVGILWILAAPVFFLLPDGIDGVYERGLGLIAFALTGLLAHMFRRMGVRG